MRVPVEHEIGVGLAKPREIGTVGVDIGAARLPRRRMDQKQPLAADRALGAMGPARQPLREIGVDTGAGAGALGIGGAVGDRLI